MNKMSRQIIFKDGWTLDGSQVTDEIAANAFFAISIGYKFGLTLEQFYHDTEMVYFYWRGTKRNLVDWYTYAYANESEDVKETTIRRILNK